jgi:ribosomal protein S18 acetylase RimI-like enzyme
MALRIVEADLSRGDHAADLVDQLDAFVRDPAVGGAPLPPEVREHVAERLREHPTARAWLAYGTGEGGEQAVGFAVGIVGFSTFAAQPTLNVHDLGVSRGQRGRGIGRALLQAMEDRARQLGCCKLTLEVREDNRVARALYDAFGFGDFEPGGEPVPTLFLEKKLGS